MGVLELVSNIVQAAAWPTAAVVLGVALRHQVGAALTRLRSGELPGGIKVEFRDEEYGKIADLTEFEPLRDENYGGSEAAPSEQLAMLWHFLQKSDRIAASRLSGALEVAGENPNAAVLATVREVEVSVDRTVHLLACRRQNHMPLSMTESDSVQHLLAGEIITEAMAENLRRMFTYRSQLRDGADVSSGSAALVLDTARQNLALLVFQERSLAGELNPWAVIDRYRKLREPLAQG